jgi:uncharacterized membrane protein
MPPAETPRERLAFRLVALAAVLSASVAVLEQYRLAGWSGLRQLGAFAASSLFLIGKFVIFGGVAPGIELSTWGLALMVVLIDILIAIALASGLEVLERNPLLGRWLASMRAKARQVLDGYPALERMAFWGVALYVFLPVAGTGAVTGSIAARLVGLSRLEGVLAVTLPSLFSSFFFALMAELVGSQAEVILKSPLVITVSLIAALVVGFLAWGRIKRILQAR